MALNIFFYGKDKPQVILKEGERAEGNYTRAWPGVRVSATGRELDLCLKILGRPMQHSYSSEHHFSRDASEEILLNWR